MVQVRTVLKVADNSGAQLVRVIGVLSRRRGRPTATTGSILSVSVIKTDPAVKVKKVAKGEVHTALLIRTADEKPRRDGGWVRMPAGGAAAVLLARGTTDTPLGSRVRGPVSAALRRDANVKVLSLARAALMSTTAVPGVIRRQ